MTYPCPACGRVLDLQGQLERAPARGDWALCAGPGCLAVLRFEAEANGALTLRITGLEEQRGPEAPADLAACLGALKRSHRRDARAS